MNDTSREAFEKMITPVLERVSLSDKLEKYALNSIITAFDVAQAEQAKIIAELEEALDGMIESYEYEASSENPALLKAKEALSKAKGIV